MSENTPPQIQAAVDHFSQALRSAEGRDLDPLNAGWAELEAGVVKLLGGAFSARNPAHQNLAFMLGATLAQRLCRDLGAFWFRNRAAPQGAALGFPQGVVVLSPFEASLEALARSRVGSLGALTDELRGVLAQAQKQGGEKPQQLDPDDYRRLFDPGFVQFVALEALALKTCFEAEPAAAARDFEHAFSKLPAEVPADVSRPMRGQVLGALKQLDAGKPLGAQAPAAPQLLELLALLHGGTAGTGFAPVEFWEDVLVPLLHIGAATSFPPLDEEEIEAFKQSPDPVLVYVETVPFAVPAADEDGLLNVFPADQVGAIDPCFRGGSGLRLARIAPAAFADLAPQFDAAAVRAAVERFRDHCAAAAGGAVEKKAPPEDQPALLDVALVMLTDLLRVVKHAEEKDAVLCLRFATESEAASEPLLHELRKTLKAPRIVLANS